MGTDGGCDCDDATESEAEPGTETETERNTGRDGDPAAGTTAPSDVPLSLNATLEVLAHHHRRDILRFLVDEPDHIATVDQLVDHLSRREAKRTGVRPGRDQLEIALHHIHLPKLTQTGIIEYDARSKTLRYRRHDRLEAVLESDVLEDEGAE